MFTRKNYEDDSAYMNRVFRKYDNENEEMYILRIDTVLKVIHYSVFYSSKFLDLIRTYYLWKYSYQPDENPDNYERRLLSKFPDENFRIYKKRIKILQKIFPQLELWESFIFDKTQASGYRLSDYYKAETKKHAQNIQVTSVSTFSIPFYQTRCSLVS